MAIKNKKPIWLNSDLDLKKEFDKKSFEKLIEYSNNNRLNLMQIWLTEDRNEVKKTLRIGTSLLNYFEDTLSKNLKSLALFKLGSLYGHLSCLNRIVYDADQNNFAKSKLETVKMLYPKYSDCFEDIIIALFKEQGSITEKQFIDNLGLELQELKCILNILLQNGLIHYYEGIGYSLNDSGIRLAKQLTETIKN